MSSQMLVYSHSDGTRHVTPPGHPERVERLAAVDRGLAGLSLDRRECQMGEEADVLRCHPDRYLARIKAAVPDEGWAQLDGDTFLSPGSFDAAMRAVGGICAAVDAVVSGETKTAFVAGRPPGHHAEHETAMGFCLFGTVAIGAKRALDHHGLPRVAVLDFDVHHGNGTQDLLWDEARCLFVSSHQMPLYPGTGRPEERGAHGQIVNIPLRTGSGGQEMRRVWVPALHRIRDWQPQLVLLSAGFDAHRDDPLGGLDWTTEDFRWLSAAIGDMAAECEAGIVSSLEGGYDLDALTDTVHVHVEELSRLRG